MHIPSAFFGAIWVGLLWSDFLGFSFLVSQRDFLLTADKWQQLKRGMNPLRISVKQWCEVKGRDCLAWTGRISRQAFVFFSGGHTYLLTGVGIFCLMLLRTIKLHRSQDKQCVEKLTKAGWNWHFRVDVGSGGPLNRHPSSLNKMHEHCPKGSSGLGLVSFLKEGWNFMEAQCINQGMAKYWKGRTDYLRYKHAVWQEE